jgi:hypothetical protein
MDASTDLALLSKAVIDFSIVVLLFSLIGALVLQATHEALRSFFNRWAVRQWLLPRSGVLSFDQFMAEMGSQKNLFSLPYWQLTGQINAVLSAKININPRSPFVEALANVESSYRPGLEQELAQSSQDFAPGVISETELKKRQEATILRDLVARAQNGVNSLHANLRAYWNMFDYYFTFAIIFLLTTTFVVTSSDRGISSRYYVIGFFSWLATPIVRRMIERLLPFR